MIIPHDPPILWRLILKPQFWDTRVNEDGFAIRKIWGPPIFIPWSKIRILDLSHLARNRTIWISCEEGLSLARWKALTCGKLDLIFRDLLIIRNINPEFAVKVDEVL